MSGLTQSASQLRIELQLIDAQLLRSTELLRRANRYIGRHASIGAQQLSTEITAYFSHQPQHAADQHLQELSHG